MKQELTREQVTHMRDEILALLVKNKIEKTIPNISMIFGSICFDLGFEVAFHAYEGNNKGE